MEGGDRERHAFTSAVSARSISCPDTPPFGAIEGFSTRVAGSWINSLVPPSPGQSRSCVQSRSCYFLRVFSQFHVFTAQRLMHAFGRASQGLSDPRQSRRSGLDFQSRYEFDDGPRTNPGDRTAMIIAGSPSPRGFRIRQRDQRLRECFVLTGQAKAILVKRGGNREAIAIGDPWFGQSNGGVIGAGSQGLCYRARRGISD
jgi:hypothetical protein